MKKLSDFSLPTSGYLNLHYKQQVPCPRLGEGSGHPLGAGTGSSGDAELTAGADTKNQAGFSTWKQQCKAQPHSSNLDRIQQQLSALKVSIHQRSCNVLSHFANIYKEEPRLGSAGHPTGVAE